MARPFKYTVEQVKQFYSDYKEYRLHQYDVRYEAIKSGERAGGTIEIKIPKVLTIASFCHFMDITEKSFNNWLNEESENIDKELIQFITRVQEEIKDFQLSGATNNIYNQNIVARMNGLNETINVGTTENQSINITIGDKLLDLKK